jgi:hypothetical protein
MAGISIDTANRIIELTDAPVGGQSSFDVAIDLYSQMKDLWRTTPSLRGLRFPLSPVGGNPTKPGQTLGKYVFLDNDEGWRLLPYDADHELIVEGNIFPSDFTLPLWIARAGRTIPIFTDRSSLTLIDTAGGGATASEIADAVWDEPLSGHLTAGSAGEALDQAGAGGVDLSAIADAVWDEPLSGHLTAGSVGEALDQANAVDSASIADAVWDEAIADHVSAGSFGEELQSLAKTSELPSEPPTVSAIADAVWDEPQADHTIPGTTAESIAQANVDVGAIADAVWDEPLSGHLTAGSAGEALDQANAVDAASIADAVWDEPKAGHTASGSFGEEVQQHSLSSEIPTIPTVGQIADAVWDEPRADHTDPGTTGESISQPNVDVDAIADAVWDEPIAGHTTPGTTGEQLDQAGSGAVDAGAIADAVWDEAVAGHVVVGSFGEEVQSHSKTSEIPTAAEVADAVWDESLADHALPDTMGRKFLELLGHAGVNKVVELVTVDGDAGATLQKIRLYDSEANAKLDDGSTGLIFQLEEIVSTWKNATANGQVVKVLDKFTST